MSEFAHIEDPIIKGIENPKNTSVPIEFVEYSMQNAAATLEKGRPVFESKVFIKKYVSKLTIQERPANEADFMEYPRHYEAFKNKQIQKEDGIPVGLLPGITKVEVDNLEAKRIYTIERLAVIPQIVLQDIGPNTQKLQTRAQQYLQQSSGAALELKAKDKALEEKDSIIEALKKQLQEKDNEPTDNGPKHSGRNATVRKANTGNRKPKQRNTAAAIPAEQDLQGTTA